MSEHLPTDEMFNRVQSLPTQEFELRVGADPRFIKMHSGRSWQQVQFDLKQARAIRDWLNKAIP